MQLEQGSPNTLARGPHCVFYICPMAKKKIEIRVAGINYIIKLKWMISFTWIFFCDQHDVILRTCNQGACTVEHNSSNCVFSHNHQITRLVGVRELVLWFQSIAKWRSPLPARTPKWALSLRDSGCQLQVPPTGGCVCSRPPVNPRAFLTFALRNKNDPFSREGSS